LPCEKCIPGDCTYICTYARQTVQQHSVRVWCRASTMNSNCWHARSTQRVQENHIIYVSCGGQSNGDSNREHCFSGNLFDRHRCALCREDHSCVLMHVCEELRPHPSCDRLCGNCIVRGLLTTPEHLTAFCPQRHVTPVVTGLLGMTLLQEIQNIVTTIDGQCLDVGRWTWSFEFEKRIDFVVARSAPSSAKSPGKAHANTDSEWSDYDDSAENIDGSACMPIPKIMPSQAMPLRRIQPARKVKDAAAARQKAMAQKIPVAQKVCKKKRPVVVAVAKKAAPVPKKKAAPAPKKKAPAPKKAAAVPKKSPNAPKKALEKDPVEKKGAKLGRRMRWNNLDLLIKVQRDNVCFFYVIGRIALQRIGTHCQALQKFYHALPGTAVLSAIPRACIHNHTHNSNNTADPAVFLVTMCFFCLQLKTKCPRAFH